MPHGASSQLLRVGGESWPCYHTLVEDLRTPTVARGLAPTTMNSTVTMAWEILDRMERAVAKVRERLLRATAVLNKAGVPYAVVGGHAVASWVATVEEGAVRNTRDIDLLVRREDLPALTAALEQAGLIR